MTNGLLILNESGIFTFTGPTVKADGKYMPSAPHLVHVAATAHFEGITGPYNITGYVGDGGIHLEFVGRPGVGKGFIVAGPVALPNTAIRGAANVILRLE